MANVPKQVCDCGMQFSSFHRVHWTVGGMANDGTGNRRRLLQAGLPEPSPGEGEIAFALEGDTDGWVGFSFPDIEGSMSPADVVLGFVDSDGVADVNPYRPQVWG